MGHALIAAARRGRHPDHPARHLLPGRRDPPRRRGAAQRACSSGSATARPRWAERVGALRAATRRQAPDARVGAAIHSVRAVPVDQLRDGRARSPSTDAPLHVAPLRAAGGERRLPGARTSGPRPSCCTRTARWARAPRRCTRPTCRRWTSTCSAARRRRVCMCPTTEAGPGRRHRPGARHVRGRIADHAGLGQPRGDRPVRGGARGRAGRAAAHRAARPLGRRPNCCTPPPPPDTRAWAGRRPGDSCRAGSPTSSRSHLDSIRLAGARRRDPLAALFAATAADVRHVVGVRVDVVRDGRPPARGRRPAAAGAPRSGGAGWRDGMPGKSLLSRGSASWHTGTSTDCGTSDHRIGGAGPGRMPCSDAALVVEDGRIAWTGPAVDAPAADELLDAAAAPSSRVRRQPRAPGVRGRPSRRVRGPDDRNPLQRRRNPHHRRRHPRRVRRRRCGPTCAGWWARCARQGTTTSSASQATDSRSRTRRARCAWRARSRDEVTYLGAHVVPAEYADRRRTSTWTWCAARCSTPARRTPTTWTCSASAARSARRRRGRS